MSSIFRHSKSGQWIYQVYVPDPTTGRSKRVQRNLKTKSEHEARIRQREHDKRFDKLARSVEKKSHRLSFQIAEFLAERRKLVEQGFKSQNTLRTDVGVLKAFEREVLESLGDVPLATIRQSHIHAYKDTALEEGFLRDNGKRGGPVAPTTIALHLRHLKAFFSERSKFVRTNPVEGVEIPKNQKPSSESIPTGINWDNLIERLQEKALGDRIDIPFCLLYSLTRTGARIGELQHLKWKPTEDHERLKNHSKSYSVLTPDRTRMRILSKRIYRESLITQLEPVLSAIESLPAHSQTYVFGNPDTDLPYNYRAFSGRLDKVKEELNLPPSLTPHSLRHGFVTEMIRRTNGNLSLVGQYIGHTNQWMTEHYKHVIDDEQRDFVDLIMQ